VYSKSQFGIASKGLLFTVTAI